MSVFANRTKPDSFYIEIFTRVYEIMTIDFTTGKLGTDRAGYDINKTTKFIQEGKDSEGAYLEEIYNQIVINVSNKVALTVENFKTKNNRTYYGWIFDKPEVKSHVVEYLKMFGALYPDEPIKEPLPPVPAPKQFPLYILRAITPLNGQGARGNIIFSENTKGELVATGNVDNTSHDIGYMDVFLNKFNPDDNITSFEFKNVVLSSVDMDFRTLAERIIKELESQLDAYLDGKYKGEIEFMIVEGKNPDTPPENILPYYFKGKVQTDSGNKLSSVLIEDNLNTQGLPGANVYSNENGLFELYGQYIAQAPNPGEIYETVEYKVKSGDTLSKIALKYPQKGLDGKDIPFYPERTMQIYRANPIMEGRSISLKDAANENQVLENSDLIFPDEIIKIPFYQYKSKPNTFNITFSKKNYITKIMVPFDGDFNILPFQKINLISKEPSKKETIKQAPLEDSQIKTVTIAKQMEDPTSALVDKLLQDMIKNLKITLLPAIMGMFQSFGITNVEDLIQKGVANATFSCPANESELLAVMDRMNKLANTLQNNYDKLDKIKEVVKALNTAVSIADGVFAGLSAVVLAFPSIPFAPDFTKFISTKLPKINKSAQEIISETLGTLSFITGATLMILVILTSLIQKILNYLSLLDELIQDCASKMGSDIGQSPTIALVQQLSTLQQSNQGVPDLKSYNGFIMEVNTLPGVGNSSLSRRQAVARNKAGIIMLKGEPSFSSNDQILIDQLTFLIDQKDLKAD